MNDTPRVGTIPALAALRLVCVETAGEGVDLVSLAHRVVLVTGDGLVVDDAVPRVVIGEEQEREIRRLAGLEPGEGHPGWAAVLAWLDLMFPAKCDRPARVVSAAVTPLERIREAMFRDGPDTTWDADTLDEVAEALRAAGLAPEGVMTQKERRASWSQQVAALVARLEAAGDESLLDDLVHDLFPGEKAADIDNAGYKAQVEAAFDELGPDEGEARIGGILDQIEAS